MFPKSLNEETNRILRNFNNRVKYNKTKTRNRGMLPERVSIREFKERYSDKSIREIKKQLKLYASFNSKEGLRKLGTNRLSKWEREYFEKNRKKTIDFYEKEMADLARIVGDKPEFYLKLHDRYQTLYHQRAELDKDLDSLTDDQIKGFRAYYAYAERSEMVKERGFRLYLSQLERMMQLLGYKKRERDALLNKFNALSENEFTEMVRREDLIDSIYYVVDSPKERGEYELMREEENARSLVEEIISRADELINKYKSK